MNDSSLIPIIGLEVHAELRTLTKLFCRSKNDSDETRPNVNICPVCMGHPGVLPVLNKEAVRHVLRMGHAVGGRIADFTEFDRKNYFYPDLPKGYQISQYKFPLVEGGQINGVLLTRIHLEEDTARSQHTRDGSTIIDFNRAGVPLMELVTEPVIRSAKEACSFARELQRTLRFIGVSSANMEKGEMRVEANVSLGTDNGDGGITLGTKVEVKNLNSFRAVEFAIEYELKRHAECLQRGEAIVQETRGWDESGQKTFSQRSKESSHDYRYFPEPDLPKLMISEVPEFQGLEETIPELPWNKRVRLLAQYELKSDATDLLVDNVTLCDFFEKAVERAGGAKDTALTAANYLCNDLPGLLETTSDKAIPTFDISQFVELLDMIVKNEISSRGAKDLLSIIIADKRMPRDIANERNMLQESREEELALCVSKVIADNPKEAAEYRNGKDALLQFLIGQAMKESKGKANPKILAELIRREIGK